MAHSSARQLVITFHCWQLCYRVAIWTESETCKAQDTIYLFRYQYSHQSSGGSSSAGLQIAGIDPSIGRGDEHKGGTDSEQGHIELGQLSAAMVKLASVDSLWLYFLISRRTYRRYSAIATGISRCLSGGSIQNMGNRAGSLTDGSQILRFHNQGIRRASASMRKSLLVMEPA